MKNKHNVKVELPAECWEEVLGAMRSHIARSVLTNNTQDSHLFHRKHFMHAFARILLASEGGEEE